MPRRTAIILSLWLAAFGVGLLLDRPVAEYAHAHGWDLKKTAWTRNTHRLAEAVKVPGEYTTTAVTAVLLGLLHRDRWRPAGLVALAGAISGLNSVLKWVAGRRRPVAMIDAADYDPFALAPFVGGLDGLLGAEKNLCFPSGHACLAFANAAALAIVLPRWRWAFYAVATAVAVERVVENAHYFSDSVAGAGLGVLSAYAAKAVVGRFAPARRVEPERDVGEVLGSSPNGAEAP